MRSSRRAPNRATLRRVLGMEFPPERVDGLLEQVDGAELSYRYAVYWRVKPG